MWSLSHTNVCRLDLLGKRRNSHETLIPKCFVSKRGKWREKKDMYLTSSYLRLWIVLSLYYFRFPIASPRLVLINDTLDL